MGLKNLKMNEEYFLAKANTNKIICLQLKLEAIQS